MLTGLFAVPAAIALAAGTPEGRKAAILWNIFGIAELAVAITLGLITRPVPVDLSEWAPLGLRRFSECADPCFRSAKLDPAARAVAAAAAPAQSRGSGAP
jgi:hypothetical protein